MKIAHLVIRDSHSGAATAVKRISKLLNANGMNSNIVVYDKKTSDDKVYPLFKNSLYRNMLKYKNRVFEKAVLMLTRSKPQNMFSTGVFGVPNKSLKGLLKYDVVHIHWINQNFLSFKNIKYLQKRTKIVISLHDSWFFTGGCHVFNSCMKFQSNCNKCLALNSMKKRDISSLLFRKKKKLFSKMKINVISCSSWQYKYALSSTILKNQLHSLINHPIDHSMFYKINKDNVKQLLNLNIEKKYIGFGAVNATTDLNKGYNMIKKIISYLSSKNSEFNKNFGIVIFGARNITEDFHCDTKVYPHITNFEFLNLIYNAMDVFILPSIQESFGQTALESITSGTPVVAYKNTGVSDIIDHKINGFLADKYELIDFVEGVNYCLSIPKDSTLKSKSMSNDLIFQKYEQIYK